MSNGIYYTSGQIRRFPTGRKVAPGTGSALYRRGPVDLLGPQHSTSDYSYVRNRCPLGSLSELTAYRLDSYLKVPLNYKELSRWGR